MEPSKSGEGAEEVSGEAGLSDRERGLLLTQEVAFIKDKIESMDEKLDGRMERLESNQADLSKSITDGQERMMKDMRAQFQAFQGKCPSGLCEARGKELADLWTKNEALETENDNLRLEVAELRTAFKTYGVVLTVGLGLGVPTLTALVIYLLGG